MKATNEFNRSIPCYDDCGDKLFAYCNEHGIVRIIRADSWESAYSIAIDESPTIEPSEIIDAHGFYLMQACKWNANQLDRLNVPFYIISDHDEHGELTSAETLVCEGDRRTIGGPFETKEGANEFALGYIGKHEINLIEGYQYQDNGSDTGIVATGHNEQLSEVTVEQLKERYNVTLTFDDE